jgi:hypothetical protein
MKEKADRLQQAFDQTLKSFSKFQNLAVKDDHLPPQIALALSRTAIDIAGYSQAARSEGRGRDVDSEFNERRESSTMASDEEEISQELDKEARLLTAPELVDQRQDSSAQASVVSVGNYTPPLMSLAYAGPTISGISSNIDLGSSRSNAQISIVAPSTDQAGAYHPANNSSISPPDNRLIAAGQSPSSRLIHTPSPKLTPQPSTPRFPYTSAQPNLTFAQRLRLSCVEQGLQNLCSTTSLYPSSQSIHIDRTSLPLLRRLNFVALQNMSQSPADKPSAPTLQLKLPEMWRGVEGGQGLVKRELSAELMSLEYGRTRMWVSKEVGVGPRGYDGEWLEPVDVQEYLEIRGMWCGKSEGWVPFSLGRSECYRQESQIHAASGAASTFVTAAVNITRLIELIITSVVCIGPGPGNRKEDIDRALRVSISDF